MGVREDLVAAAAHHQAGRLNQAAHLYGKVLETAPDNVTAIQLLGSIALQQGRHDEAIAWLRHAGTLAPRNPAVCRILGDAYRAAGRLREARRSYESAVSLDPHAARAWHELGETLAELGDTTSAEMALNQAVLADPKLVAPLWALSMAGRADRLPELQTMLASPGLALSDRINLQFAIARLLDQAGRYDEAFVHLDAANRALRDADAARSVRFDATQLHTHVTRLVRDCHPGMFARLRGCGANSELPVFVVGMPRSGTTLVEQILASHSRVRGIGERQDVALLVKELERSGQRGFYGVWHPEVCPSVAQGHLARLAALAPGADRVVDKTPDNLFHLAAIAVLFPAARVIVCRRDPRDTCLSCYFQSFRQPAPYANDLVDCAVRHHEVDRLLAWWQSVLPLRLHTVQYETLVSEPEAESRRLFEFLGLEWEPACLSFHRTRRTVRSASLWQVRQPLYAGSVGRWRHYARHIGPLLEAFGRD